MELPLPLLVDDDALFPLDDGAFVDLSTVGGLVFGTVGGLVPLGDLVPLELADGMASLLISRKVGAGAGGSVFSFTVVSSLTSANGLKNPDSTRPRKKDGPEAVVATVVCCCCS